MGSQGRPAPWLRPPFTRWGCGWGVGWEGTHPVTVIVGVILQAVQGAHLGVPTHPQLCNRTLNTEGQRGHRRSQRGWQGHRAPDSRRCPARGLAPSALPIPAGDTDQSGRGPAPVSAGHSRTQPAGLVGGTPTPPPHETGVRGRGKTEPTAPGSPHAHAPLARGPATAPSDALLTHTRSHTCSHARSHTRLLKHTH